MLNMDNHCYMKKKQNTVAAMKSMFITASDKAPDESNQLTSMLENTGCIFVQATRCTSHSRNTLHVVVLILGLLLNT